MSVNIAQKPETDQEPATPPSLTGVVLTANPKTAIVIDWLQCTLPHTPETWRYLKSTFGDLDQKESTMYGYEFKASILGYGMALWSMSRPEMGIHLILPASALAEWTDGVWLLLQILKGNGAKFTRVDVAYDDFTGLVDLDMIYHKWTMGEVTSRLRTMTPYREPLKPGDVEGKITGLGFGSRKSATYIRIYDKRLERQKKGHTVNEEHWTRVEVESKEERAGAIIDNLLARETMAEWAVFVRELLHGYLDFKQYNPEDSNKSRWSTATWWAEFLAMVGKTSLGLSKVEQTIEGVKRWFVSTIAPMAAVILLAEPRKGINGYDWLMEAIAAGEMRFKKRHKVLCGMEI